jgi:hypothetical protein
MPYGDKKSYSFFKMKGHTLPGPFQKKATDPTKTLKELGIKFGGGEVALSSLSEKAKEAYLEKMKKKKKPLTTYKGEDSASDIGIKAGGGKKE